jgi:hypothetical protein
MANRYAKYDPRNMRENPKDELEDQLADEEAQHEINLLLSRIGNSPNFRRRVVTKLAKRELDDGREAEDNGLR